MVEKGIRGGICHEIHRYAKTNNKYLKNRDQKKNDHIFSIQMQTIYTDMQYFKNCQQMVLNGKKYVKIQ